MKVLTEEELIQACLAGNRFAEKELYNRYSEAFYSTCLRYSQSEQEAEDVLIMGFTAIFSCLPNYQYVGSFEGWMRRIIINTAVSYFRTNLKHYSAVEIDDKVHLFSNESENNKTEAILNAKEILKVMRQMPKGYLLIFNLFAIEGYTHSEIAEILHIKEGTSKSQYAKAKKWLQARIYRDEI